MYKKINLLKKLFKIQFIILEKTFLYQAYVHNKKSEIQKKKSTQFK